MALAEVGPDCDGTGSGLIETVLIEGHTDNLPISGGSFEDNWDLGARRGTSVFNRLTELQPSLATLNNKDGFALLGVSSYEARRPVVDEDTVEARRLNRRIDIRFMISAPSDTELDEIRQASLAELRQEVGDGVIADTNADGGEDGALIGGSPPLDIPAPQPRPASP